MTEDARIEDERIEAARAQPATPVPAPVTPLLSPVTALLGGVVPEGMVCGVDGVCVPATNESGAVDR